MASDHNWNLPFCLRLVSTLGAAGAIAVALAGLLGYAPGLGLLGSIRAGYIPMAPSTAVSFIVLGGILLVMTFRSPLGTILVPFGSLAGLVSLFGVLEVAEYFTGKSLNFEDALVPSAGYLGTIPIARMSPSTGALFFLTGLATLALLLRARTHVRGTLLGHWAGSLGTLTMSVGLLFCLSYLYGSPLLYGRGATVSMALTTALAFLMLSVAMACAAGKDAFPVSLLANAKPTARPACMQGRFYILALLMIMVCGMVLAITSVMLYRHSIKEHQEQLQVTAQSHARLIEAVARYDIAITDKLADENLAYDSSLATLNQIISAYENYTGFGNTGEFTMARADGNSIVFILRHRQQTAGLPPPVAFDSDLAEPMRRALKGLSGTIIGVDYRGATVLAAYEPVAVLNLGLVAKIDLAEIRAPFIETGLTATAFSLLVVLFGTAMFFRISNPINERLEAHSQRLEEEIKEREQAEAEQTRLLHAIEQAAEAIVITDLEGVIQYVNPAFELVSGYTRKEALGQNPSFLKSGEHDDVFYKQMWDTLKRGENWKHRIVK